MEQNSQDKVTAIRALFPNLTEGQLEEAEGNLLRFAQIALRIHEARERTTPRLDQQDVSFTMEERSNPTLKTESSEHG